MKNIIVSLSIIVAVAAVVVGATTAFYGDTETSRGNVLAAGSIDLGIDNESYYNGVLNPGTSWALDYDIEDTVGPTGQPIEVPRVFFNFHDLKPGDWGEDTISLHVKDNDSYLCADVTLTSDDDNGITEPEGDDGDTTPGVGEGELANAVNFYWWADDGDNVYEDRETLLPTGPLGVLNVGQTATVDLADANNNIWGDKVFPGGSTRYIGKAWCFGDGPFVAYPALDANGNPDNSRPDVRPVKCDGSQENNITQTDSFTSNISFRAVQSRNNPGFECEVP